MLDLASTSECPAEHGVLLIDCHPLVQLVLAQLTVHDGCNAGSVT